MSQPFKVIIPARFASTRLPGKPLRELAGRCMLQYVFDCAQQSGAEEILVATDDARIQAVAEDFGAQVCMTSTEHRSGTDRLAEVVDRCGWSDESIVINLQGDEPLMLPELVRQVAYDLGGHPGARIATLATPILAVGELFDPNVVKVVEDRDGYALYFSRATIPWDREAFQPEPTQLPKNIEYLRHIGLYAYRVSFLRAYAQLTPAPIEQIERLEQLRALWHGERIHVARAEKRPGPGVDTEDDMLIVEQLLQARRDNGVRI
jgi:3-deoxy-manno-octulosonate cytidylyltransferase (CMP-KDO synthetase)